MLFKNNKNKQIIFLKILRSFCNIGLELDPKTDLCRLGTKHSSSLLSKACLVCNMRVWSEETMDFWVCQTTLDVTCVQ